MHNQPAQSRSRRIQVRTNAFLVTRLPTSDYYMYDVDFQPPIPQMPKRNKLVHHLMTTVVPELFNPHLVYDGRSIAYYPGKMNLGGNNAVTFTVMLGMQEQPPVGTKNSYQIRINLTSSPPIRPQDVKDILQNKTISQRSTTAINIMQLIVRQGPNMYHTNNGRAYFTGKEKISIGGGVELWRGIFQSMRPTFDGMALTIDTSAAVVYKDGPLISVAMDFLGLRDVRRLKLKENDPDYKRLEKFLKKLRVKVKTGANGSKSRIKTIRGLEATGAEYQFQREDTGDMLSVMQYFKEAYGIHIQHPHIVGISLSGRQGSGKVVVPMELCEVEIGQLYKHKVREEAVAAMVKFSTIKPEDKLKRITDAATEYQRSDFVYESGMHLSAIPMQIGAKILPSPRVQYGQGQILDVRNGSWNVVRQKFFRPGNLLSWAIVNFEQRGISVHHCERIVQDIRQTCQSLGMNVKPPHDIYPGGPDVEAALNAVMKQITIKMGPAAPQYIYETVLFIILPEHAAALRVGVKQWGDSQNGVRTQCLRENKVMKANSQYWNNVMLKINPRVGGINSTSLSGAMTRLLKDPFIIMGADVSHPGPGVPKPSIASLVYSHDRFGVQYASTWDFQHPRQEHIEDLKQFVKTAVHNWGTKNGTAPKRIIFFRDGLSEGELENVAKKEIEDVKAAIQDTWTMNKVTAPLPLLTFIVVGKRHHAVFFPASFGDPSHCDKNGNCNAGTVFDLRHPALDDFYLQSHAPIQGTCRSSHYIVSLNENSDFSTEDLQELAYSLCTVYAKATRSVSIPAPVYYADSVCSRGPFQVNPSMSLSFDDGMSMSSGEVHFDLDAWKAAKLKTNSRLEREMYFL